jgi:hypothetical protein
MTVIHSLSWESGTNCIGCGCGQGQQGPCQIKWETHAEFLAARHRLQGLKVVNDTAERGVALIQAFNKTLTHDEDQLQFLLQVVSEHRRLFPSTNKNVLAATSQPQQFYD